MTNTLERPMHSGDMPHEDQLAFAEYERLLEPLNEISTQFQGMGEGEFKNALSHDGIAYSHIQSPDGLRDLPIPQLCPVSVFPWLNEEEYIKKLPDAEIRHFQYFDGLDPSDEVRDGVQEVANQGGYIVFDHPDSATDYRQNVADTLHDMGVEIDEEVELGTQTYFAGKIFLKAGLRPDEPIRNMRESFESVDTGETEGKAKYESVVDPSQAEPMRVFYNEAFREINKHPCRQGLDWDEFYETMSNPDIAKLTYDVDGKTATICVLGDNLAEYSWLNEETYKKLFPEEYANKQILYFPALATDPQRQGERNTEKIVALISEMLSTGNNEAIIAFDCCDANVGMLDVFLDAIINETPECGIDLNTIGRQIYTAFKLKKPE